MRFQYASWGETAPEGAIACDGLVPGARLDLSHWVHNKTPAHLRADTSVEIALNFLEERAAHDVDVVVNNHFDTDGVLAIWTLLSPSLAKEHEKIIIAAAEVGDFDEWPSDERGMLLECAISRLGGGFADNAAYRRVLPKLDELVPNIGAREDLWGESMLDVSRGEAQLASGEVSVERVGRIAVYEHAANARELPGVWMHRRMPEGTDRLLVALADGSGGYQYRYQLPRHAWAVTVRRPKIATPRRGIIRRKLGDAWIVKGRRGMTGVAHTETPVRMTPGEVARALLDLDQAA
jgi:hypothetical protein